MIARNPLSLAGAATRRAWSIPGLVALVAALALLAAAPAHPRSGLASRQSAGPFAGILPHPAYGKVPLGDEIDGAANAVNDRGTVVGTVEFTSGVFHAALWSGPTPIDLGTLGGPESFATAINAAGQVAGQSDTTSPGHRHAFLRQHGVMRDLGTLGGPESLARGINSSGSVVGAADTLRTDSQGNPIYHAALWQHGKARDLGTLGGDNSVATAINYAGQVVGYSDTGQFDTMNQPIQHAFLWKGGQIEDLDPQATSDSEAVAINRHGDVVGDGGIGGILWGNGFITLGSGIFPQGINDRGDIVGYSEDASGNESAFLMHDGTLFDLNTLIPSLALLEHFDTATAINNSGQICAAGGFFVFPIGRIHEVALLSPCAMDVTSSVQVTMGAAQPTGQPGHYRQKVHLRNVSGQDIPGPVSLVADNIQPPGLQMQNQGVTACLPPLGSPYVTLAGNLKHGQTRTVNLAFAAPTSHPLLFTYTPRVLAGPGMR